MKASLCNLCKHEHWLGEAHVLPNAVQRSTIQKAPVTLTPIVISPFIENAFRLTKDGREVKVKRIDLPPVTVMMPLSDMSLKSRRGRPQLSDTKLTPAERKRRQRARQVKA